MEELKKLSKALTDEVHGLRGEVEVIDKKRRTSAIRTWVAIALMTVAIFFTGVTSYLVYDCTNSNGRCAKRGAQGTGSAIATINYTSMASNYCAKITMTEDEYLKCVQKKVPEYQEKFSNK